VAKAKVYVNTKLDAVEYKKFCIPVFNRATYARVKSLIKRFDQLDNVDATVVLSSGVAMEKYGNAAEYIKEAHNHVEILEFDEDNELGTEEGAARMSGDIISSLGAYLARNKFDGLIVVADRFETIQAAMAGVLTNTPVIHIQGGEITGNLDERVRHACTKLADYHYAATGLSRKYIIDMGENYRRVRNYGCPSLDLIREARIRRSSKTDNYIIGCFHPETENQDEAFEQTEIVLKATLDYCRKNNLKVHWFWPNPDPGREEVVRMLDQALEECPHYLVKAENRPPEEFVRFLSRAVTVVGNSSMAIRECSYLGIPAVNVGLRQGYRERAGNVIDVDFSQHDILAALARQHRIRKYAPSTLYGSGHASYHIVASLMEQEITLKPSLTYPFSDENEKHHFGAYRFEYQNRKRQEKNRSRAGLPAPIRSPKLKRTGSQQV